MRAQSQIVWCAAWLRVFGVFLRNVSHQHIGIKADHLAKAPRLAMATQICKGQFFVWLNKHAIKRRHFALSCDELKAIRLASPYLIG